MINPMEILLNNAFWMTGNILLGIIAVVLGWLAIEVKSQVLQVIFGFLWLLFIPNTIYMLTDVIHLKEQFIVLDGINKIVLILQYIFLFLMAFVTFLLAMYPFEKMLIKIYKKNTSFIWLLLFITNFVIAFGLVIGRMQRTNSWEVFTNLVKVIQDSINVLTSVELMMLVLFFGIFNNLIYFLLRQLIGLYGGK